MLDTTVQIRWYLVEQAADKPESWHALTAEPVTIGRSPDNTVVLPVPTVSRQHAAVQWDGEHFVLQDLGSSGGTFQNGTRLAAPSPLEVGDRLVFGGVPLTVRAGVPPRSAAPPPFRIDLANAQVWRAGQLLDLTAHEYRALVLLYGQGGTLVSKEALARQVWPEFDGAVADESIQQLISRLRRKLEPEPARPQFLRTVRGLGYRLTLPQTADASGRPMA